MCAEDEERGDSIYSMTNAMLTNTSNQLGQSAAALFPAGAQLFCQTGEVHAEQTLPLSS